MGRKQNGAQAQAQPCGHQQPPGLPHRHRGDQNQEKPYAAPGAAAVQCQADDQKQRKKEMDAHLDAHPAAQRN